MTSNEEGTGGLVPLLSGQLAPIDRREIEKLARYRPADLDESESERGWLAPHGRAELSAGTVRALGALAHEEQRFPQARVARPSWLNGRLVPGVLIALLWNDNDAFGTARLIREMDISFRRGNALLASILAGERPSSWPLPTRPERGGLWLLDIQYGSFEAFYACYGGLVTIAASTPVSLASFGALAWSSSKSAVRVARDWSIRFMHPPEIEERPEAHASEAAVDALGPTWQERTVQELVPLLQDVVSSGRGFELTSTGPGGEVRIIVPSSLTAGSD
jgi:hypothetical protein